MQHRLFDLSGDFLDKREKSSLVSFIYGNKNNVNRFPPSSLVKTEKEMYEELASKDPIFDIKIKGKSFLG